MDADETLPFPPPFARRSAPRPSDVAGGAPSLEQLTEARLAELAHAGFLWETPPPRSNPFVVAAGEAEDPSVLASEQTDSQIVLAAIEPEASLAPLRWRGLPVSEELQLYAMRVARGEDLAPYRGPIVANSSVVPWVAPDARAFHKGKRGGARLLLALAALGGLAAFVLPSRDASLPELEQRVAAELPRVVAAAPAPLAPSPLQSEAPERGEPLRQSELAGGQERPEPHAAAASGAVTAASPERRAAATPGMPPASSPAAPKRPISPQPEATPPGPVQPDPQHAAAVAPSNEPAPPGALLLDEPSF